MSGRFRERFGPRSAFDSFYYPYRSEEERWAVLSIFLHHLYQQKAGKVYKDLKILLQDKPYQIMTTNQDFLFFRISLQIKSLSSRETGAVSREKTEAFPIKSGTTGNGRKCVQLPGRHQICHSQRTHPPRSRRRNRTDPMDPASRFSRKRPNIKYMEQYRMIGNSWITGKAKRCSFSNLASDG